MFCFFKRLKIPFLPPHWNEGLLKLNASPILALENEETLQQHLSFLQGGSKQRQVSNILYQSGMTTLDAQEFLHL